MKGLILKDWYMMKRYSRTYLFVMVISLALSLVNDNRFFLFYPCLLCCMIPINLMSYDERSGWMQYSGVLPYTKTQIVSSKYLMGLFVMATIIAVTGVVQMFQMHATRGGLVIGEYFMTLFLMWIYAMVSPSLSLPLVFRFGTQKGGVVYLFMVAMFFGIMAIASRSLMGKLQNEFELTHLVIGIALLVIGMYALSWYLSVVFYRKREV